MLGIHDDHAAFVLDRAVAEFSWFVDKELEKAGQNAKGDKQKKAAKEQRLRRLLSSSAEEESKAFADPAAMFGSKE